MFFKSPHLYIVNKKMCQKENSACVVERNVLNSALFTQTARTQAGGTELPPQRGNRQTIY